MIKQSKVKSVSFRRSYSTKFGTFYVFFVSFENGDSGEYTSKFEKQEFFIEGNIVNYDITVEQDNRGESFNKVKPDNSLNKPSGSYSSSKPSSSIASPPIAGKLIDNSIGMMVGNAISNACVLAAHGKIPLDHISKTAEELCNLSMELKGKF